jgi:hypothetical protein
MLGERHGRHDYNTEESKRTEATNLITREAYKVHSYEGNEEANRIVYWITETGLFRLILRWSCSGKPVFGRFNRLSTSEAAVSLKCLCLPIVLANCTP